jgi:hypothetical protein
MKGTRNIPGAPCTALIVIFTVMCLSCEKKISEKDEFVDEKEKPIQKSEKNVSERFLRIDGSTDTLRSYELGKNLFGKFFKQRAEFYIIENPNKTLYNKPVKSITLYFLDGALAKTKYELDDDISDDLIQSYGTFTIKGYDTLTRGLFKREKIISVNNQRRSLNKNLTNYELKWELESKFVYARVNKSAKKKKFEYIEALKHYSSKFRQLESLH